MCMRMHTSRLKVRRHRRGAISLYLTISPYISLYLTRISPRSPPYLPGELVCHGGGGGADERRGMLAGDTVMISEG